MTLLENSIKDIINIHSDFFLNKKNVIGVALGYKYTKTFNTNILSLHVLVEKKTKLNQLYNHDLIPKFFLNIPTDVIEIGELQHFDLVDSKKSNLSNNKYSFLKGICNTIQAGYSIGAVGKKIYGTTGTIGAIVSDNSNDNTYILSNNQVLAMLNRFKISTPIIQPGFNDTTTNFRKVGKLYRLLTLVPDRIHLGKTKGNIADCALAKIDTKNFKYTKDIYGIGPVSGTIFPTLGTAIKKCGRGSGITTGNVISINAKVSAHYNMTFKDQILCSPMAISGDSGSLVLDNENKAIGLIHVGSKEGTFVSPIDPILRNLNIHF